MTRPAALDDALARASAVRALIQGEALEAADMCVTIADAAYPLTEEAKVSAAEAGVDAGEVFVSVVTDYVAVLTQTCDLQRTDSRRAYCLVAPVRRVSKTIATQAAAWRLPGLVPLPWVDDESVADLSLMTTVERSVLVGRASKGRPSTQAEQLKFADAVARYLCRPALPEKVVEVLRPFVTRIGDKHDKQSDEGRCLRLVQELRLEATPDIDSPQAALNVLLLLDESELPSLPPGAETSDAQIEALKEQGLARACKAALTAQDPVEIREAWTAVAEVWLEPSVNQLGAHPEVGSVNIEVLNGEDLSHARSRNAPQLDLQYLTSRAS